MCSHRKAPHMAKKPRQTERLQHIVGQDRPEGSVRDREPSSSLQTSEFDKAQYDGRGTGGLVQSDIEYPCAEIVPNAIILYLEQGKGLYLSAEEGMLLGELLQEASEQSIFCEMDA